MGDPIDDGEEWEFDSDFFRRSDKDCDRCCEALLYGDEIVLLEPGAVSLGNNKELFWELLQGDDGDYLCEPIVMHFGCWEDLLEDLYENVRDTPTPDGDGDVFCGVCERDVPLFSPLIILSVCELQHSKRTKKPTATFTSTCNPSAICLKCGALDQDLLDIWNALFNLRTTL